MLSRRVLAPISAMTERAKAITAEKLSERLPVLNPGDELGQLAAVFNAAFSRLEQSFAQLRHFTADASHELRTPLTAIRSVGEVGLQGQRDAAAYREVIGSMLEETRPAGAPGREPAEFVARRSRRGGNCNWGRSNWARWRGEVAAFVEILAAEKRTAACRRSARAAVVGGRSRLAAAKRWSIFVDNAIKYGALTLRR